MPAAIVHRVARSVQGLRAFRIGVTDRDRRAGLAHPVGEGVGFTLPAEI
jgi:hypothetical protein